MAAIQDGDILRVTAKMLLDSEEIQNVFYAQYLGTTEVDEFAGADLLADRLDGCWGNINTQMSQDLDYLTIEVYNVTQDAPIQETGWLTQTSGAAIGDELPFQVAMLATFPTALKKSLGKKYIGGYTVDSVDDGGVPNSTTLSNLADFVADLLSALTTANGSFQWGHIREDPLTFVAWLSGIVETIYSTQRRRKIGVGQ